MGQVLSLTFSKHIVYPVSGENAFNSMFNVFGCAAGERRYRFSEYA